VRDRDNICEREFFIERKSVRDGIDCERAERVRESVCKGKRNFVGESERDRKNSEYLRGACFYHVKILLSPLLLLRLLLLLLLIVVLVLVVVVLLLLHSQVAFSSIYYLIN
jgi:hypothetical protein